MILGIGIDLIEIDRIENMLKKYPHRFVQRVFTPGEQAYASQSTFPAARYAKRFAAKEAFFKALGTGLSQGISWQEVEVKHTPLGQPCLFVQGKALRYLYERFGKRVQLSVSLTDTQTMAQAIVILSQSRYSEDHLDMVRIT
jgi:holo-[acyl-carrier protein] synthase